MELDAEGDNDMSGITQSVFINVTFSLQGYVSLFQERSHETLIDCPSKARDVFPLELGALTTFGLKRQLVCYVGELHSDARQLAGPVELLECQPQRILRS